MTPICLSVRESTVVTLLECVGEFQKGTKFVYRIEDWHYPELKHYGYGFSQLWYVGATREEVPRWLYSLLLKADFHLGAAHRLKELFQLDYKEVI
jgi:hypothetical protein